MYDLGRETRFITWQKLLPHWKQCPYFDCPPQVNSQFSLLDYKMLSSINTWSQDRCFTAHLTPLISSFLTVSTILPYISAYSLCFCSSRFSLLEVQRQTVAIHIIFGTLKVPVCCTDFPYFFSGWFRKESCCTFLATLCRKSTRVFSLCSAALFSTARTTRYEKNRSVPSTSSFSIPLSQDFKKKLPHTPSITTFSVASFEYAEFSLCFQSPTLNDAENNC